jgi:hypothetical protein
MFGLLYFLSAVYQELLDRVETVEGLAFTFASMNTSDSSGAYRTGVLSSRDGSRKRQGVST